MGVTAKDVKELREATGAGMMDCKKALEECGSDFDKAPMASEKGIASGGETVTVKRKKARWRRTSHGRQDRRWLK